MEILEPEVTWQTIEVFNSILASCGSQDTPEIETLNNLLDSFHHLATTNKEKAVWTNFGFELGVICVKILSAIERSDLFEDFFLKLLSVISAITEHDSDVWKATARQILNLFINKKFSFYYLEKVVRVYVSILKKVEGVALNNFSHQNLTLLRSLSMSVRGLGDFETQVYFMELVFLHFCDRKAIPEDFFFEVKGRVRDLFRRLRFVDFEGDCRIYLNALNEEGPERRVLSILCGIIYLGGCFMEPPAGRKGIWVDVNKMSEKLSLKCSNFSRERVVYIPFSDLQDVMLKKEINGSYCVTIKTINLKRTHKEARNNNVLCKALETDTTQEEVQEFVDFLEERIRKQKKKLKKLGNKLSQSVDDIYVDRSAICYGITKHEVQNHVISNSIANTGKPKVSEHPKSLRKKPLEVENKDAWEVLTKFENEISPIKAFPKSEVLSPNSFVESLNKNLGLNSPERKFEDSVTTIEFSQKTQNSEKACHTLHRASIFDFSQDFNVDKENKPPPFPPKNIPKRDPTPTTRVLRERKNLKLKFTESQSQDYFRRPNPVQKKPSLPKLKKKCTSTRKKKVTEHKKPDVKKTGTKQTKESKQPLPPPSLLDPNGYAYQRWLKPTTSKRSNFWLEKLNALQKPAQASTHVFDFSESEEENTKKSPRIGGIAKPKRKKTERKKKQTTIKEVKEKLKVGNVWKTSLKTTAPREQKMKVSAINPQGNEKNKKKVSSRGFPQDLSPESKVDVSISLKNFNEDEMILFERSDVDKGSEKEKLLPKKPIKVENVSKQKESLKIKPTDLEKDSEDELVITSDDEFDEHESPKIKKRGRSDEEKSLTKAAIKKKPKTFNRKFLSPALATRLQQVQEKAKQQTKEIVEAAGKATYHLFNHLKRKESQKMVKYLKAAKEAGLRMQELNDTETRVRRIQRVVAYYEAGCSARKMCESMDAQFSKVQDAVKDLNKITSDSSEKVKRICDRLKDLIESEIDRVIKNELKSKQNQLLQYIKFGFGKYLP